MTGFDEGQRIWIEQPDGSQRPGVFVGEAGNASWLGGSGRRVSRLRGHALGR